MNITVSKAQGRVPVTILRLEGQLDGQNFQQLINRAKQLYGAGSRDFLLDLSDLAYISSAGLVALHTIALLARGEAPPDPEQGWAAMKSLDRSRGAGKQEHVKVVNPTAEVNSVLDMVGFSQIFDIFSDQEQALKAF